MFHNKVVSRYFSVKTVETCLSTEIFIQNFSRLKSSRNQNGEFDYGGKRELKGSRLEPRIRAGQDSAGPGTLRHV
jgi:hypothetical protein